MKHICISIALATLATIPCFGQQSTTPTTIVGKDHPELIDDATAYWHLFQSLSRSDRDTDDTFKQRRLAFANQTGLTPTQVKRLLVAADQFTEQLAPFKGLPETPENHEARTNTVLNIAAALHQNLGPYASSILTYYLNTKVKATITIFQPKQH